MKFILRNENLLLCKDARKDLSQKSIIDLPYAEKLPIFTIVEAGKSLNELGFSPGDEILFNPKHVDFFVEGNEKFYLVSKENVIAKLNLK